MAQLLQCYKDEEAFLRYYKEHLLNKTTATFDKIQTAGLYLGKTFDTSCPTCARNSWNELLSIYNQLEANRNIINTEVIIDIQKEIEPVKTDENDVYTKLEYEEIKKESKTKSKK